MNRMLFGYGSARGTFLKHKKLLGAFGLALLIFFLAYTYVHEGRPGKVRSSDLDHNGPDPFAFLQTIDPEELKKLAIGEADVNPEHAGRLVDNLVELSEESLVQSVSNTSAATQKLIYDNNGKEVGLRFLVLSDWGGDSKAPYTTHTQMNVARALAAFAAEYDCSFILSLGDNFCDNGVTDVNDMRFEDTFEDVFTQASLQRPWYIVAGDRDYKGNVSALIDYTQVSRRWNFESRYYKMSATLPTFRNVSVDFVMIDTVQLCGGMAAGGGRQPAGPANVTLAEKQWSWIDHTLRFSGAEYVVVAGHYPVFSGGRHGSTRCLVDRLKPILERNRVSAYFGGHDHSVQHIKSTHDGGVHYFVAGASSPDDDHPEHLDGVVSKTRYFWTNHLNRDEGAFLYCDVRKDEMLVSIVKSDKAVLYVGRILPRNHPANLRPVKDDDRTVNVPVLQRHPVMPAKRPSPKYRQHPAKQVPQPRPQPRVWNLQGQRGTVRRQPHRYLRPL